jgi:hypothetical protein
MVAFLIITAFLCRWAFIQLRNLMERDPDWRPLDLAPQDLWARWRERGRANSCSQTFSIEM